MKLLIALFILIVIIRATRVLVIKANTKRRLTNTKYHNPWPPSAGRTHASSASRSAIKAIFYLARVQLRCLLLATGVACLSANAAPLTWSSAQIPIPKANFSDIIYAGGRFVTVGYQNLGSNQTQPVASMSPDGAAWLPFIVPTGAGQFNAVAFGDGHFVAVGKGITAISPDGLVWLPLPLPAGVQLNDVAFGGGWFVAAGQQNNGFGESVAQIWISPDGLLWVPAIAPTFVGEYANVATDGNNFVVIGADGSGSSFSYASYTPLLPSLGGLDVGGFGLPSSPVAIWDHSADLSNINVTRLRYLGGNFQAVGFVPSANTPALQTSGDGSSWTDAGLSTQSLTGQLFDLADYDSAVYAAGMFSQGIGTSINGKTDWTTAGFPAGEEAVSLVAGNQVLLAVGNSNSVYLGKANGSGISASPPQIQSLQITAYENQATHGSLASSVSGTSSLTYSIDSQPANATLSLNPLTGHFVYTPNNGFTGSDSFSVSVTATASGTTSSITSVEVTVLPDASSGPTLMTALYAAYQTGTLVGRLAFSVTNGHALTYQIVTPPSQGTFSLTAQGGFSYITSNTAPGSYTALLTATDTTTHVISAQAALVFNVTDANSLPPLAQQPLYFSLTAGQVLSAAVGAGNPAGNALTYAAQTQPAHGTLAFNSSNGSFTYTPTNGFSGTDSFTYTATDSVTNAVSNTATVYLTVFGTGGVVPGPVAADMSIGIMQGQVLSGTLSVSDAAGNPVTYAILTQPAKGTATLSAASGAFIYTPTPSYFGTDTFTFTGTDSVTGLVSNTATVTVTVQPMLFNGTGPAASPPVASNVSLTLSGAVTGTLPAAQAQGDPLIYSVVSQPSHGTLQVKRGGGFSYVPADGYTGADSFTFLATDSLTTLASNTATVTLTVQAVNSGLPPTASGANFSVYQGVPFHAMLMAADSAGNTLVFSVATQPSHGTLALDSGSSNGAFTYTPSAQYTGSDTFSFTATDTKTLQVSAPATVIFTVSALPGNGQPPVASNLTLNAYTGEMLTGQLAAADPYGSTFHFQLVSQPSHGQVQLTDASAGTFTYSPAVGYVGQDSFTFTATSNATGLTSSQASVEIATLAAIATTTPPMASPISVTAISGTTLSGVFPGIGTSADTVLFNLAQAPSHGSVTVNPVTGQWTYAPAAGFTGTDSFTYDLQDISTGATSASQTVSVTVLPTPPTATLISALTSANTPVTGTLVGAAVSGPFEFAIVTQPLHGTLSLGDNGSFTYTPASGFSGEDMFTYTVTANGQTSAPVSVVISVSPQAPQSQLPPSAATFSISTTVGTAITGTLPATPADGASFAAASQPAHGTLTLTAGTYTYTPTTGFTGTDAFTYTVTENGNSSTPGTVNIRVIPASPAALSMSVSGYQDTAIAGSLASLEAEDASVSYQAVTQPAHGTLTLNASDGTFVYTPATGYTGQDQFTFTLTDADTGLASNTASITLIVLATTPPANTAPSAQAMQMSDATDAVLTGSLAGVDALGNPLSYAVQDNPANATLSVTASGSFTYTPNKGYSGTDTFTYTATDTVTQAVSKSATVTVVVSEVSTNPPGTTAGSSGSGAFGWLTLFGILLAALGRKYTCLKSRAH